MTTHGHRSTAGHPARARLAALAASALLALAAGACGGSDDEPEEPAGNAAPAAADAPSSPRVVTDPSEAIEGTPEFSIGVTYHSFRDFLDVKSGPGACVRLTESFIEQLGGRDCRTAIERVFARTRPNRDREIERIRLDGDTATAVIATDRGTTYRLAFALEDDRWKIDGGKPWR